MVERSRRSLLRACGLATVLGTAGCQSLPGSGGPTTTRSRIRWRFEPGGPLYRPPVVPGGAGDPGGPGASGGNRDGSGAGGTVYVAGTPNDVDVTPPPLGVSVAPRHLYALDATDGARRWHHRFDAGVRQGPFVGGGRLHVTTAVEGSWGWYTGPTTVHQLTPDGRERWQTDAGIGVAAVGDDRAYLGSYTDGGSGLELPLYGVDLDDGTTAWESTGGSAPRMRGRVVGDTLVVNFVSDLAAYRVRDGTRAWSVGAGAGGGPPPVVDGKALVGAFGRDRTVQALDAETGGVAWTADVPDGEYADALLAGDGTAYVVGSGGTVLALRARDGRVRWRERIPGARHPVVSGGTLFAATGDGVVALEAGSGRQRWQWSLAPGVRYRPVVGPGAVYVRRRIPVPAEDGEAREDDGGIRASETRETHSLHAIDREDGAHRWRFRPGRDRLLGPALASESVVVASGSGTVYGLRR